LPGKRARRSGGFSVPPRRPLTVVSEHAGNRESSFCLVFCHESAVLPPAADRSRTPVNEEMDFKIVGVGDAHRLQEDLTGLTSAETEPALRPESMLTQI
jgi:hypothetical protein